ncbi:hypothetical protein GGI11_000233 [Coemansia sp. RSA 2049]|nr:hypothetical protein GGI11_000233 [Coemansia sp. RSA 2049]
MDTDEGDADVTRSDKREEEEELAQKDGDAHRSTTSDNEDSENTDEDYEYVEEEFFIVAALPDDAINKAQESWKRGKNPAVLDDGHEDSASNDGLAFGAHRIPKYAVIDIDTERPMLEIEGSIYQGMPDELLGTSMLFDINTDSSGSMRAEVAGTTSRVITFYPVDFRRK